MKNNNKHSSVGQTPPLGKPKIKISLMKKDQEVSRVESVYKNALDGLSMRQDEELEIVVSYGHGFTNSGSFKTKAEARKFLDACLEETCWGN